jgi:hypothetical protein
VRLPWVRDARKAPSQEPDAARAASGSWEGALRGSFADPGEPRTLQPHPRKEPTAALKKTLSTIRAARLKGKGAGGSCNLSVGGEGRG